MISLLVHFDNCLELTMMSVKNLMLKLYFVHIHFFFGIELHNGTRQQDIYSNTFSSLGEDPIIVECRPTIMKIFLVHC